MNKWCESAWDDVHGKALRMENVKVGRAEEIGYMQNRNIWSVRDTESVGG